MCLLDWSIDWLGMYSLDWLIDWLIYYWVYYFLPSARSVWCCLCGWAWKGRRTRICLKRIRRFAARLRSLRIFCACCWIGVSRWSTHSPWTRARVQTKRKIPAPTWIWRRRWSKSGWICCGWRFSRRPMTKSRSFFSKSFTSEEEIEKRTGNFISNFLWQNFFFRLLFEERIFPWCKKNRN